MEGTSPETLPGVNAQNYPKVDGSTANLPLMAALYSTLCGVPQEEAQALVDANGTADAWRKLAYGEADLLLVYEAPESVKRDLEEMQEAGEAPALEAAPLGRDGLVFLVNAKNKVENLTQEQLRDIYTGKITDWEQAGGEAGEVKPFQRNPESGSQTMFLKLLMKDTEPVTPPTELTVGFMGALIDAVAGYDGSGGALGFSVFYYANEMYANPDLKLLAVDGVAPSAKTIGDGSYPLVNDFFVAIRADEPEDSPARLVRDWLLTDAGKELLVKAGYVPAG